MITLRNLFIGYKKNIINTPLNGHFKCGSMTAIIGNNGVGKSTLLKTIAGLVAPINGELKFNNKKKLYISYLPQQIKTDYQFPLTVFDVVAMGCIPFIGFLQKISCYQQILIKQALSYVGLFDESKKTIRNLSEGQFRRMLFARILVQQAPIILLDEPFINIDKNICLTLITAIKKLYKQGSTVVVVLHDTNIVKKHFANILLLTKTKNIWHYSA